MKKKQKNNKAFTLVELSIVFLVLAFLVSGLLVGRQVIKRAKFQSIMNDVETIKRHVRLFTDQYGFVPGDGTRSQCEKFDEFVNYVGTKTPGGTASSLCNPTHTTCSVASNNATCSSTTTYRPGAESNDNSSFGAKNNGIIETLSESIMASHYLAAAGFINTISKSYLRPDITNLNLITDSSYMPSLPNNFWFLISGITSLYYINCGVTNPASPGATGCANYTMNTFGIGPIGFNALSHWNDKNFIIILGKNGYFAPSTIDTSLWRRTTMTIKDAKQFKTKYDDPSSPYTGNIAFAGGNTAGNMAISNSRSEDATCAYTGLNTVSSSGAHKAPWGTQATAGDFYSVKEGCKMAFLIE